MKELDVPYLVGNEITKRIIEFPPVVNDEQLADFRKLIDKMYHELYNTYYRKVTITDEFCRRMEVIYPWAFFRGYEGNLMITFKEDYLNERGLCVDGYGRIQRRMHEL